MSKTKEKPLKKALKIINNILILTVVGLCFFTIITATLIFTSDNGDFKLLGYGLRIVLSSSMEKNPKINVDEFRIKDIPTRSLILIELVPCESEAAQKWYSELQEGDVLTFMYKIVGGSTTITHRIQHIEESVGGYKFTLAGDNIDGDFVATQIIDTADKSSGNHIIGKVIYSSYFLGIMVFTMRDPLFAVWIATLLLIALLSKAVNEENERNKLLGSLE